MTPVLAHAGHWATSLVYLVPVALIVAALAWQTWRERHANPAPDADATTEPTLDDILDGKHPR